MYRFLFCDRKKRKELLYMATVVVFFPEEASTPPTPSPSRACVTMATKHRTASIYGHGRKEETSNNQNERGDAVLDVRRTQARTPVRLYVKSGSFRVACGLKMESEC